MPKKKKDYIKYIKFIWHYLKPYKNLAVFLILLAVIVALIDSFIPYFMGVLVDVALGKKDFW